MRRKGFGIFLALCLLVCSLTLSMSAEEPTGTPISSADELIALMKDSTAWAKDYYLTQDIDLTGRTDQAPIGSGSKNFTGTFDGCGYEIKNLNLVKTNATSLSDINWALFGRVNGATIKNLTVSGTVNGSAKGRRVGGIVGVCVTGTAKIENCVSNCTVTGAKYVGGIVGHVATGSIVMSNCMNTGAVEALTPDGNGYADLGGLIGLAQGSVTMTNCMNTGSLTAPAASTMSNGGLAGRIISSANILQCYSAGKITSGLSCAFVGYMSGTLTSEKNYYLTGDGYAENISKKGTVCTATGVDLSAVTDPESCKTAFADLPTTDWVFTVTGPELLAFHAHDFGDDDMAPTCATCGMENPKACQHADTEEVVDTPSTCAVKGSAHMRCKDCGETVGEPYELPLNPDVHANFDYVWHMDGASYYYNCADCGKTAYTQTEAPTLYVDAYTKASALVGDDANDGLTKATAVLTIEEAFRRLADVGGTVCLSDRYYVSAAIDFPANSKKITVTSDPKTGFYFEKSNLRVRINGDVEFCNMFFYADKAANDAARLIVFVCNWHDVTFGEGLATSVNAYVFAGTESTADDTAEQNQTLVFHGVNQTIYTGSDNLSASRLFYHTIVLGSRTSSAAVNNLTSNKTITATFNDYSNYKPQVGTLRCATSSQSANANIANCETTICLNDGSTVGKLIAGDKNMNTGAAALDKLTVELNDNATVTGEITLFNIKAIDLTVSAGAARTAAIPVKFVASFSEAYTADGTESLVASYGTHSFAADTGMADGLKAGVNYSAYYEGRVTVNLTDECTWTDANANGTYAKTCSCGRTETVLSLAFGSATATSTGSTVRFIAEMTLGKNAAVEKYGMLITALADQTAGSGSFADEKFAFAEGTDVTAAADGKLRFAADLTGIPAGKGDTPIYAWAYVKLAGVDDLVILPFTPVTTNGLNTK